jgi:hypothetical protein
MDSAVNPRVKDFLRRLSLWSALSLAAALVAEAQVTTASPSREALAPPGYSLTHGGGKGDFDFLAGAWTTVQLRLVARGVSSTDWRDSPPNVHCATHYLNGAFTAEESFSPAKGVTGLFLYAFDVEKRQWTLYWIDPKVGKLEAPLVGGFSGSLGEFYGEDVDDGRPVKVRYSWIVRDRDHARWEQAFSFDNRSWETNWTSEFTRTDQVSCQRRPG